MNAVNDMYAIYHRQVFMHTLEIFRYAVKHEGSSKTKGALENEPDDDSFSLNPGATTDA